jgi:hypothetical protein
MALIVFHDDEKERDKGLENDVGNSAGPDDGQFDVAVKLKGFLCRDVESYHPLPTYEQAADALGITVRTSRAYSPALRQRHTQLVREEVERTAWGNFKCCFVHNTYGPGEIIQVFRNYPIASAVCRISEAIWALLELPPPENPP